MSPETAAADPPELPPGTHSVLYGFLVVPKYEFSVDEPMANSSMFVLPETSIPFSFIFSTTVALKGGMKFSSILEAHVVLVPSVFILSFTATGIPSKGDSWFPAALRLSDSPAEARSFSGSTVIKALMVLFFELICSMYDRAISADETSLFSSSAESSMNPFL